MTVLTEVTWLTIAAGFIYAVLQVFGARIGAAVRRSCEWAGEALNDWCERYQTWWHATGVDRLARHQRRQEQTR